MAYPQVIIPPSVKPVSPLELSPTDDLTTPFSPRFSRGTTQRQVWGDPVWTAQARFEGLSGADRALLKAAIMGARGGASNILMTPGIPIRGSFPATELLTNNDFSNGTTGWSVLDAALTVSDRVARVTMTATAIGYIELFQVATLTQYAPHAIRAFYNASNWPTVSAAGQYLEGSNYVAGFRGLGTYANVSSTGAGQTVYPLVANNVGVGANPTQSFVEVAWTSLSRCILADASPNALTYSDQIDNGAWTGAGLTSVAANSAAQYDPFGTTTAEKWTEDTSTGAHYRVQTGPTVSATADYCGVVYARRDNLARDVQVTVGTTGTGHYGQCNFDLNTQTAGTPTAVGSATDARAFAVQLGNNWLACYVVVRLPTTATRADLQVAMISGGAASYTGTTGTLMVVRGGVAQSSVPFKPALVTSTALAAGTAQTGSTINVKGLPVSTSGLLLAGDFFEVNGELMQAVASLDSDAAGLGVLQMNRAPMTPITDNIPIIVNNPFGRFRLASDPRIVERFGVYTDVDLQLIEATA